MQAIDLHVHSTASDGTDSPREILELAKQKNLKAIALTDHDTVGGIEEALLAAQDVHVRCIPGIEISTMYEEKEIHVVGLFLDWQNAEMQGKLKEFQKKREKRNEVMAELLQKEGFSVTMEELREEYPNTVITRAHFARLLHKKGYVKTVNEAFEKYIGDGCRCHVGRQLITPMEACEFLCCYGAMPILAHPILYNMNLDRLRRMIREMKNCGLVGLEALYSTYTKGETELMKRVALEEGLLISGGSDYHGSNKPHIQLGTGTGSLYIPETVLEDLEYSKKDLKKC